MKKLQKVRLINWHRFSDETIPFERCVLLSGENGAGKSTILDAIQFAITCSKANFNKAAHEKGKRNLNSYIRCKTGQEDHPYEREGALSAHICLEFYDDSKQYPFLLGVVMDTATEEKEPNTAWYLMENQSLKDELFFRDRQVKGIQAFRTSNKGIKNFATTVNEAKKMILARFGRLDEKFFALIPKALAFKPIHDIKDFVYSYVLDSKEVNIDALRENVHSYQDLELLLRDVKKRIEELDKICSKEGEVENYQRLDRNHEYFIARAVEDIYKETIAQGLENIRLAKRQEEENQKQYANMDEVRGRMAETILALEVELNQNEEFRALSELEKEKKTLEKQIEADTVEVKKLKAKGKKTVENLEKILSFLQEDKEPFVQLSKMLQALEQLESLAELMLALEKVAANRDKLRGNTLKELGKKEVAFNDTQNKLQDVERKIRKLEEKRLIYPKEVELLQQAIKDQFTKLRRTGEVRILCETLEILEESWQNAVEGYLNKQRFYLLVEPEDFDMALSVYDKMRQQKLVYGAGLINTGKLESYDETPVGSLAEVVSSKNIWAKRYINMILGRVQRCDSYRELKQYKIAITKQCMRYQNHVASAISPTVYSTPYIGAQAAMKQLQAAKEEKALLQEERKVLEESRERLQKQELLLNQSEEKEILYLLPKLEEERAHKAQLKHCLETIKEIKQNETLIQKRIHLRELKQEQRKLEDKLKELFIEQGKLQERIKNIQGKIQSNEWELKSQSKYVEELFQKMWENVEDCEKEYQKLVKGIELTKFKENREKARKANETLRQKAEEEMVRLMREYKVAHDFGAADSLAGFPDFQAELDKLKNSQLLEYEEKVYRARNAAEEEFREQFLSRLQENIKQARNEFKELNRALEEIPFSKEHYEFLYEPKGNLKRYYTMIMDDFNLAGGASIFSGIFMQNHKEVIDELFEKLALDDEDSAKTLEFFTDYRSYMDYDIKITLPDGNYMLYSKVSREKSGGETQTPFYITMAASFMQLYRNSIGGDAVGLMMMDEAFNNMDDDRMAGVLEFLTSLHSNLQIIIAAPPDKIQYIGAYMDKVLLALQAGNASFIEEFARV
ncbi:MAG: AAA family ATPase [Lachnospiraceae bacterium]|nr:AAA family ATPase [Lachnospiraceae bacterium]